MIFADFMTDIRIALSLMGGIFGLMIGALVMCAIVAGKRPKKKPRRTEAPPQASLGVKATATVAKFLLKRFWNGRS